MGLFDVQFSRFIRRNWKSIAVLVVGLPVVTGIGFYRFDVAKKNEQPTEVLGQTIAADAPSTTSTTEVTLEQRNYSAGDCVKWDQDDGATNWERHTEVVPCDQDHLFEYVSKLRFQRDGDYPTEDAWNDIIKSNCTAPVTSYLGYALDPNGKFRVGALRPSHAGWLQYDRTLLCGIQSAYAGESADKLSMFKGIVKDQDQTYLLDAGRCYRHDDFGAVDCAQPHDYEVVGSIEIKTKSRPSSPTAWQNAAAACQAQARTYANGSFKNGTQWGWLEIEQSSWDAGSRTANCIISKWDANGNPVQFSGAAKG